MENNEFDQDVQDAAVYAIYKRNQPVSQLVDYYKRFGIGSPISGDHLNRATITG